MLLTGQIKAKSIRIHIYSETALEFNQILCYLLTLHECVFATEKQFYVTPFETNLSSLTKRGSHTMDAAIKEPLYIKYFIHKNALLASIYTKIRKSMQGMKRQRAFQTCTTQM